LRFEIGACRGFAFNRVPRSLMGSGAALSPRRATLVSASLRFATGNLRCSAQPGSRSNSPAAQTIAGPFPSGPALLGAFTRVGGIGSGTDSDQSGLCVATIFIAARARISWARGQNYFTTRRAAGFSGSDRDFAAQHPQGATKARRIRALTPKTPDLASASESAPAPASDSNPPRRVAGPSSAAAGGSGIVLV
jgi:hypothetical protein